jgi:solute carrier family 25 oxoglutarate transporter 11
VWNAAKPFMNGGLSGMIATCIIQPIDIVKVRLQLSGGGSPFKTASNIVAQDGFFSLYRGLSAGLLRQATYTTARLGIFNTVNEELKKNANGGKVPLWQTASAGLAAGGLGALFGSPADLSLIRMQSDSTLPVAQRRNYKNVGDALVRIVREEGVMGLFEGAGPTAARAMALNMGMLASNEKAKDVLDDSGYKKGTMTNTLTASAISGFFASFFSLPFDYVKTQMQKQQAGPDGKLPFPTSMSCVSKTFAEGGPLKFWTGFPTYYVRIAPHVMFTLLALEQIVKFEKSIGL